MSFNYLIEYKHTIDQDNIAIVAVEVGTPTNSNFETVFKKADEKATVAYRLGCHLAGNVKNPSTHQTSDSSVSIASYHLLAEL